MLIHAISEYLHKLLQNGRLASIALLCEFRGVVVVAVYTALMFVIRVLSTKHSRTDGARKMLNVVLAIQGCNVGAAESATTRETEKIEASKVIGFA